jgi:hypothetical protein
MNVVDAHAFDVIAGDGDLVDDFALIDGEDRDGRVRQIGGDTTVADVVEAVVSVILGDLSLLTKYLALSR